MRLWFAVIGFVCLLGASFAPTGSALAQGAAPPPGSDSGSQAPDSEAESTDPPDPAPGGPGIAEATGDALSQVVEAARRDGVSWARRLDQQRSALGDRLREARDRIVSDPRGVANEVAAIAQRPRVRGLYLPAAGGALLVLLVASLLRGRGDVGVSIDYPTELRGTFTIKVSRRKAGGRRDSRVASPAAALRAKRRAGAAKRTEHHLISRETHFRELRSGRYFITIDGFVQPSDTEEILNTHFEEREIRVRGGQTVRVEFDFRPRGCTVEVRVLWDRKPAPDALVAVRGAPHSLRYTRSGPVRIGVARGPQTLVVGSGDRVAELPIVIESFQPTTATVDLADRERILFTGCPPAVEPYLHGDIPAAARALERDGQTELSHLLLGRLSREQNQSETAARHFEQAGRTIEAAELRKTLSQFERSAQLYESAGELVRAAEMYRSAGDPVHAGDAYQRASDFERAVECFQEAGDTARWITALERKGTPFEAAKVAMERDDWARAIRSLQQVAYDDPAYVEAANILIDAYQREGHLDLAADQIEQIIRSHGADRVPIEKCDELARRLEENGDFERALDVLETIRRRDATFPAVASRIENLRKQRSASPATGAPAALSVPATFTSEFRYEILEELGRGGMGIVFKARDRRLGREVALKKLPDNLRNHPKAIELFLREARAAAALNHPNIVTVHDAGQEGDTFYITMELLEGMPLQNIVVSRGRLTPRDSALLGIQIAQGLHYAHEHRIIHRDVKTGNIFFTKERSLKIMDFGLAKMVEEVRRASTVIGGTPYYMAPEQSLGEAVDHRADLYALGATFFELLTGRVPFVDGDVALHHRVTPPPDPREFVPEIPEDFAALVLELLAKKPDGRPESAAVVMERLRAFGT